MSDFQSVVISKIKKETEDCVTLFFDVSPKDKFEFTPGQYLTIKANINGEEIRRAYSICTSPIDDQIGVTVKTVQNGKMSTFLNTEVKEGDALEIMPPEGKFTLITSTDIHRDHYFFAAGSGITPVMSMIKTLLEQEPKSTAYLLYGSKNEDNIIFGSEIEKMQSLYEGQLVVEMTLSNPHKEKSTGILGVLGKKRTNWRGLKGRIDSSKVASFIQNNPPKSNHAEYYICGPGNMIETIQTTLLGNAVKKANIHQEYFSASDSKSEVSANKNAILVAIFNGDKIELPIQNNKSILDTMLDAGHDAPYSCTSGACSTCMAKVNSGSVEMEACFALDDDEVENGYILTCQSHPTSDTVEIDFDV